jgi:phosphonate transport system substrate-binding protein
MSMTRRDFAGRIALLGGLGIFVVGAGCDNGGANGGGAGSGGDGKADAGGGKPSKLILGFVPSVEADKIADTAKPMADFVSKEIGIPIETFTSTDYAGMVEAMGSKKVDIGSLSPFAYVLAKDQSAADVMLKTSRRGSYTYPWMFVARADSGIKKVSDAKGKKIAFVDASSTSGYLYPAYYLKQNGYEPDKFFSQTTFAGGHDTAVRAVYNGDVDVAAVYDDARTKVEKAGIKDIKQKVVIIYNSKGADEIPNDTISLRTGMDPELAGKIKAAFLKYAASPEGKKVLEEVYEVDNLAEAKDSDYDPVRAVAKDMGVNLQTIQKKATPSPKP